MGAAAYHFVDWLELAGQKFWQLMPLSPVGYGDSPYAALSAFAGNPLLISVEGLGFLNLDTGTDTREYSDFEVDSASAAAHKLPALRRAFDSFEDRGSPELRQQFREFESDQNSWLRDFAFFMALKERFGGVSWQDWPEEVRVRDEVTLARLAAEEADAIEFHAFVQFLFRLQWTALKRYANERGIRLIGDIPIYVALDSADVWSSPGEFRLLTDRSPVVVSGVPPDLFT
jgi:4-alpha-glucanotransferase